MDKVYGTFKNRQTSPFSPRGGSSGLNATVEKFSGENEKNKKQKNPTHSFTLRPVCSLVKRQARVWTRGSR